MPTAILFALTVAPAAHAARSEVIASVGTIAPANSEYRFAAEYGLNYGRNGQRNDYEGEVGYLREATSWLTVGPVARLYWGRMRAPYDGIPALELWAGSLAARAEIDLLKWPRLFVWADPSLGLGSIGVPDARKTLGFWGIRGGVGIGSRRDAPWGLRLRVGYGYAPTFSPVTDLTGTFEWGGVMFMLDGVFRVSK